MITKFLYTILENIFEKICGKNKKLLNSFFEKTGLKIIIEVFFLIFLYKCLIICAYEII